MGKGSRRRLYANKRMLNEKPGLGPYAKDKENLVTSDAS